MLSRKFLVPALMAALFAGATRAAATEDEGSFNPFFQVEGDVEVVTLKLKVYPNQAFGQICSILADGVLVAQFPIEPGVNTITVPMMGSVRYEALAPAIQAKPFQSFSGWGIN